MADSFGIKLGIEGEKEFKKALSEINQSFKVLGSEMKLATSQFDKNENSIESLTAKNQVLTRQIDTQKDKISTLKSALQNASESFGENDRRTQQWVVALNNAEAELNGMERELSQNEKAIDSMGNEMDEAADDAGDLGNSVDDAGNEADGAKGRFETLGTIVKATAAAMAATFAAVATAAVAAGKALVDMTRQGAMYADDVLTTSTVTGIATDKLQEYMYSAELVDVSVETMTKSMAKNIKSMKSAGDGSKTVAEAYGQLGISVTNADGSLRNSDDVYWEIIDGLGSMTNETERDALAMTLLGKSAQELNPLIEAGSDKMKEFGEQAHTAGYVLTDEMLAAYGAFDDQCQYLTVGVQAVKNSLGTILLPMLTDLASEGVSLLGEFANGILSANGDISKMGDVIGEILPKALNKIMEYMPAVNEVIYSIFGSFGSAIVANLPAIIASASEIVLGFLNGFIAALPAIADGAVQLINALTDGLLDNLPALVEAALQMVATLALGIAQSLPELIPSIVQTVVLICQTLLANMDQVLAAALAIIQGLTEGIINSLPVLVAALPQIITGIVTFVTSNLPLIVQTGIQVLGALIRGILQAIPTLVASIPRIIAAIVRGLGQAVAAVAAIGKNIVQGLWNGIASMASWIAAKVRNFLSNIVSAAKRFLGIRSPSRVFAGIGSNMGAGIGVGFTNAMDGVEKDMQNAIPTDFDLDMNTAVTGVGGINTATAQTFDVTIPLTIDGNTLSRVLARIQWSQNAITVRNLGTA